MTYNTDSFGNGYHNGFFPEVLNGGNTYNNSQTAGTAASSFASFYGTRFDGTRYFILNNPKEFKTTLPPTGSNYRFDTRGGDGNPIIVTNDSTVTNVVNSPRAISSTALGDTATSRSNHAVMDQDSLFFAVFDHSIGGITGLNSFCGFGWVDEPLFQTDLYKYANIFQIGYSSGVWYIGRPTQKNSSTGQACLISGGANYSVTCLSGSSPGPLRATNLAIIDSTANNYMSGYVPTNLLKISGGALTAGRLYQIDGVGKGYGNTNPNTEQNKYIALAPFGTDWLVQRAFVEV